MSSPIFCSKWVFQTHLKMGSILPTVLHEMRRSDWGAEIVPSVWGRSCALCGEESGTGSCSGRFGHLKLSGDAVA